MFKQLISVVLISASNWTERAGKIIQLCDMVLGTYAIHYAQMLRQYSTTLNSKM